MDWFDGRYTSFDVESTGVNPHEDRIVQWALVSVGGGEPTRQSTMLIDPGVEIPQGASDVHGITTERARAEGETAPAAIQHLRMGIIAAVKAGRPIVSYNGPFDWTMLDAECRRHRIDPPDWQAAHLIDPLVIWKWADRFRRGSRNLTAACEAFGVELADAHDAGADALAVARLAWVIFHKSDFVQGKHPEIIERRALWKRSKGDLDALRVLQTAWAREQAISLRDYFQAQAMKAMPDAHDEASTERMQAHAEWLEKAASVSGDWPITKAAVVT